MQGKVVWSEFAPIFGRREKGGVWSKHLQGRTLPDAKNVCRLNIGSEQPVKSLKSPQCGDFLQTLVKSGRHWFVAMKTTNAKIPLEKRRFCGSEQPVKSLKSPQCGDFLQTLVKSGRHWFVAMKTTNAKIPLEKRRFCTGAGTSSVPKFTKGE